MQLHTLHANCRISLLLLDGIVYLVYIAHWTNILEAAYIVYDALCVADILTMNQLDRTYDRLARLEMECMSNPFLK